jgi:hypothetical protein
MTSSRKTTPKSMGPVAWGLSKTLLASLTRTILFSLFPDRLDPRDWMTAKSRPAVDPRDLARAIADRGELDCREFWFDFVADTGDSTSATESVGYYIQGDLFVSDPDGGLDQPEPPYRDADVVTRQGPGRTRLPTGWFLLMGGDLAYAIADDPTIRERLVAPFNAAYDRRGPHPEGERPYLFAVPGNHDWYDSLEGFNRLLRIPPHGAAPIAAIDLKGFQRAQRASYAAVDLPFGWSMLVVDSRIEHDVDYRQRQLFGEFLSEGGGRRRRRLIVATPRPPIVFGELQKWAPGLMHHLAAGVKLDIKPAANEARVYLSGDSHHYARHPVARGGAETDRAVCIVCGLGGASMHPPRGDGSLKAARTFPLVEHGKADTLKRLWSPRHMIGSTGFAGFGAVVGFFIGAGMGAFDGEPARFLREIGWLRFAPTSLLASKAGVTVPRTLVALLMFAGTLWLFVRFVYKRRAASESTARATSKIVRSAWLAVGVVASAWIALVVSHLWQSSPSAIGAFDATAYLFALASSIGLGIIMNTLTDDSPPVPAAKRALIFVMGTVRGIIMVGGMGFVMGTALNRAAAIPWLAKVLEYASEPGAKGFALYSFISFVVGAAGALLGALVVPVLFGWLVAILFGFGHFQTFAGSLAQIDRYRSFVRFRLRHYVSSRHTELTGFVIGVDGEKEGAASLVDTFSIRLADDPPAPSAVAPETERAEVAK